MSKDEEAYREVLAKEGVELPEEPKAEEPKEEEPKEPEKKEPEEPKEPLQKDKPKEDEPPRKRSIYEEYKSKKDELKTEKELREKAEQERDELARKLEEASNAKGKDADEATEDAIAYAKKVGADPALVERIIKDAQKGIKPEPDEALRKDIDDFKAWKLSNAKVIEAQRFNEEFEGILPSLKEQFPNISDDEIKAMKKELDAISHTKEWHDKDLDYIVFKNREKLSTLVSPKKRGMEAKGRKDVEDAESSDFDPNADYTKMSPAQRETWEKQYKELMKTEGLVTDSRGRKTLV